MTRFVAVTLAAALTALASPAPAFGAWIWPLRGEVITRYRNADDPYAAGQHRGIDIAGRIGHRVVAAVGGVVRFAGNVGSSGLTVSVRTRDGRFDVSYLHLSSVAVRRGERVAGGATIGAVGTTGKRSAARPHLHFGVRDAGTRHGYHDPLDFLPPLDPPPPRPTTPTPVPVPAPSEPDPLRAPVRTPAPIELPARAPAPAAGAAPRPAPAPVRIRRPQSGPSSAAQRAPAAQAVRPGAGVARPRTPSARPGGGIDVGRLVTVAGLLTAALALTGRGSGRAPGPRAAATIRRSATRIAALVPAFAGRGPRAPE